MILYMCFYYSLYSRTIVQDVLIITWGWGSDPYVQKDVHPSILAAFKMWLCSVILTFCSVNDACSVIFIVGICHEYRNDTWSVLFRYSCNGAQNWALLEQIQSPKQAGTQETNTRKYELIIFPETCNLEIAVWIL